MTLIIEADQTYLSGNKPPPKTTARIIEIRPLATKNMLYVFEDGNMYVQRRLRAPKAGDPGALETRLSPENLEPLADSVHMNQCFVLIDETLFERDDTPSCDRFRSDHNHADHVYKVDMIDLVLGTSNSGERMVKRVYSFAGVRVVSDTLVPSDATRFIVDEEKIAAILPLLTILNPKPITEGRNISPEFRQSTAIYNDEYDRDRVEVYIRSQLPRDGHPLHDVQMITRTKNGLSVVQNYES